MKKILLATLVALPALALGDPTAETAIAARSHLITDMGISATLGGGVGSFFDTAVSDRIGVAGTYGVRVDVGTRQVGSVEVGYQGTMQSIDKPGFTNAQMNGNAFEAALRVNWPIEGRFVNDRTLLEPFLFGGMGWTRYDVVDSSHSAVYDLMTIPAGAGLAFGYQGFIADARFTYRPALTQPPILALETKPDLTSWTVGANLGWEF